MPATVTCLAHFVPLSAAASATEQSTKGRVAQLAEHSALNRQVVGSIPTAPTNLALPDLVPHGVDSISGAP